VPDWNCAVMCQGGGEEGVISSCRPYEMDELRRVFAWCVIFLDRHTYLVKITLQIKKKIVRYST